MQMRMRTFLLIGTEQPPQAFMPEHGRVHRLKIRYKNLLLLPLDRKILRTVDRGLSGLITFRNAVELPSACTMQG